MEFRIGSYILITVIILLFLLTLIKHQKRTIRRLKKENERKNKTIMEMAASVEQNIEYLVSAVDKLTTNVDKINRGLYGDEENNHPGLIERQKKDEQDIELLKSYHKKEVLKKRWWAAAIAAVIGFIEGAIHFIKDIKFPQ